MTWFVVDVPVYFENFDLTNIITPINADAVKKLLIEAEYGVEKTEFLYYSFSRGFSLQYNGPTDVKMKSPNLKLNVGNHIILWNKVMKEVRLNRFAGPFKEIPFESYIQSPIGLVPKDHSHDTRLIFHLSYPKQGTTSVNVNTPSELCTVKYTEFDTAVQLCLSYTSDNNPIYLSKSDAQSAFRVVGLEPGSWSWTILKAISPFDSQIYYFVDKCLPFGSSISCALFQKILDAVAFLVTYRTRVALINYLDDFLFISARRDACNQQLFTFLAVSKEINMPISEEKTIEATTSLSFLGFLIDGECRMILIPIEKTVEANLLISEHLEQGKRKTTLLKLQQLCGFLSGHRHATIH